MRRLAAAAILTVLLSVAVLDGAYAQAPYRDSKQPTTTEHLRQPDLGYGNEGFSGFLDPSRFDMSHSIGMGYMSAGGQGYTQGYYMNTITYRFNAPVIMRLRTGVTNNPYATSGSMTQPGQSALSSMFNNAEFFGGADLLWKPTKNSALMISVNRSPGGIMGMNPFYNHYGMWNRYGMFYDDYDPWNHRN